MHARVPGMCFVLLLYKVKIKYQKKNSNNECVKRHFSGNLSDFLNMIESASWCHLLPKHLDSEKLADKETLPSDIKNLLQFYKS